MTDTRIDALRITRGAQPKVWLSVVKIAGCSAAAVAVFLIAGPDLEDDARRAMFILVLAASLWLSEALPAFAVALLVIGLEIALLGRLGEAATAGPPYWERFVATWGTPLIWLFFGGFVLAAAAEKTGLATWLAAHMLRYFGSHPSLVLLGCMLMTAVFSMFISNTATATMMLAMLAPVVDRLPADDRYSKALLLGVAIAANLGGMGTIIGSPPNAIAAGALAETAPINFARWMLVGLPPAALLLAVAWAYLTFRYRSGLPQIDTRRIFAQATQKNETPIWQRVIVMVVFAVTVCLWLTGPWHGIPTTVVSFVPICALTTAGVLDARDIRGIPWDVLLLIAGGLSLGVAIADTGLADWIITRIPLGALGAFGLALALCYLTAALSNLMSNTAATNVIVPIALGAAAGVEAPIIVPIALGASAAMCLPISTPPNAIVYGTGRITTGDLLIGGLLLGAIGPPMFVLWARLVLNA